MEAIVPEDLWHQTALILGEQEKPDARPGKVPARLFGGLTFCQCGNRMYVPSGSRKYTCTKCKNKILGDDLEAIFEEQLTGYFDAPEKIARCFEQAHQNISEKEAQVESLRRSIQQVRDEMARTHRLYLDGQIPLQSFGTYH